MKLINKMFTYCACFQDVTQMCYLLQFILLCVRETDSAYELDFRRKANKRAPHILQLLYQILKKMVKRFTLNDVICHSHGMDTLG
jgi:hypothetical protein